MNMLNFGVECSSYCKNIFGMDSKSVVLPNGGINLFLPNQLLFAFLLYCYLQRRSALYQSSVKEFLNFFNERDRLVTVDVSCGVSDLIWHRVSDFLGHELSFLPKKTINTVILFGFGKCKVLKKIYVLLWIFKDCVCHMCCRNVIHDVTSMVTTHPKPSDGQHRFHIHGKTLIPSVTY